MKHELPHFQIGDSYGGNQDWFRTFMMRIGGCAAETACDSCVYFAKYRGMTKLVPFDPQTLDREQYVSFAHIMEPYLHPRLSGVNRLDLFTDGFGAYLRDRSETRLTMTPFDGTELYEDAAAAIRRQIDNGYPIPTLILNHQNKALKDYVWHWFLINGYEETASSLFVKAVTYSKYEWLDFSALWDTGNERKGGLILFREIEN